MNSSTPATIRAAMTTIKSGSITVHGYRVKIWFAGAHKAAGYRPNYSHVFGAQNEAEAKAIAMHEWSLDSRRAEEIAEYAIEVTEVLP